MENKWHVSRLVDIENKLATDLKLGLSTREARNRIAKENKRENGKKRYLFVSARASIVRSALSFLLTPSILLLTVIALLCFIFGNMLTGALIAVISVLGAAVGGYITVKNEKNLSSMSDFSSPVVRVVRGGKKFYTDGRNVVVGDIITVRSGDLVTCDARIVSSNALTVKEIFATRDGIRNRTVQKSDIYTYSKDAKINAPDARNMLYAGSAVLEGEAIAVAVATGADVYLAKHVEDGALSGNRSTLKGLNRIQSALRKTCLLCAAGLLIFSVVSIATLPSIPFVNSFLLLLSTVSFVSVELISILIEYMATSRMCKLASTKTKESGYASVKSIKALDALAEVDELILMNDVGICDGSYHVTGAYVSDCQLDALTPETVQGNRLLTYIHTYLKALRESNIDNEFVRERVDESLANHLKKCGFDTDSASTVIMSLYYSSNGDGEGGYACAETADAQYRTAMSFDSSITELCEYIRENDGIREISDLDKQKIDHYKKNVEFVGARCLYIVSGDAESIVFEGVVVLEHNILETVADAVSNLKNAGVGVTVFMSDEGAGANIRITHPALESLFNGKVAFASEFALDGKEILDGSGDYCAYVGFNEDEYARLIEYLKENGKTVAVYAADNEHNKIMSCANVAISCDGIRYSLDKYKESVYERLTPDGRDTGARCSQQTRLLSGALVNRRSEDINGLNGIYNAIIASRSVYINISRAMLLFVSLMTLLMTTVVMSVITGSVLLNAVLTTALATATIFVPFVLLADMSPSTILVKSNLSYTQYPYEILKNSRVGLIARTAVCVAFALMLKILDAIGIFGENASYALTVYLSLILAMLADIYMASRKYRSKKEINVYWIRVLIVYTALVGICALITQAPISGEILPNGIGKYELLATPVFVIIYFVTVALVNNRGKRRNKD